MNLDKFRLSELTPKNKEEKEPSSQVSYSRLGTYKKCPTRYRYDYLSSNKLSGPIQDYFIKGSLTHSLIEEYHATGTKDGIVELLIPSWIEEQCKLPIAQSKNDRGINPELLSLYAHEVGLLVHKSSPGYIEKDRIRKKDGTCPVDPLEYPTGAFSKIYNQKDLFPIKQYIDVEASQLNKAYSRFSLANTAARAAAYFYNFYEPTWFKETLYAEFDFSKKPIAFNGDKVWLGFADWIYKTKDDAVIIADYKSGKEKPSGLDVLYHGQLNTYAGLWLEQTGKLPDYISIVYVPTGEHIVAKTNYKIVAESLLYLESIQQRIDTDIKNDHWLKAYPSDFGTPCWSRDWKSKALKDLCPYIKRCWPHYAKILSEETLPFTLED